MVVTYPAAGDYTPGDVYELFLDDNFRVSDIPSWIPVTSENMLPDICNLYGTISSLISILFSACFTCLVQ